MRPPAEGLAGHEDRAVLVHALEERRVARPGERGTERQIKARCGKLLDHVVVEPDEAHAGRHRHDPELRHPVQPEAVVERNHDEGREERRGGHDGRDGARVRLLQRQILKPVVERNAGDAEKRELRLVDQLVGKELLVGENQKHRVGEEGADRQNRKGTEALRVEPFGRNVGKAPGGNRDKREKKARKRGASLLHMRASGVWTPPFYCARNRLRRRNPHFSHGRRTFLHLMQPWRRDRTGDSLGKIP